MRGTDLRLLASVLACLVAFTTVGRAFADGEAGLVIQEGETVRTYCIAFTGDGISGNQLLKAAGQTFDAYGGGSGLAVCSIGSTGCGDAGSFQSCFCQCQGGNCTYWAFFTRGYGKNWVYSAMAFNLLKAKDGDVHGWKWGKGSLQSAPAPQDVTFEQICGHAPRGGAPAPTATTPAIQPTVGAPVTPSAVQPTATAESTGPATLVSSATAQTAASPSALVTIANSPTATAATPPDRTPVVSGPVDVPDNDASKGALVAFGAVVAALLAAVGGAAKWKRSHRG